MTKILELAECYLDVDVPPWSKRIAETTLSDGRLADTNGGCDEEKGRPTSGFKKHQRFQ